MDCDVERHKTGSGRVATNLVLLPDADISDPENEPDSDYEPSWDTDNIEASDIEDDLPLADLLDRNKDDIPLVQLFPKDQVSNGSLQQQPFSRSEKKFSHTFRWRKLSPPKPFDIFWKHRFSEPPDNQSTLEYFQHFNWFTTLELQLKSWAIWTVGTVRSNRLRGCPLKSEKELKKEGRASADTAVDANSGLAVGQWLDNSSVQLSSTHTAMEPMTSIKRWDRKQHKYVNIPCPAFVKEYNEHMGGVDLFDMLMSLYKVDHKNPKWYRRIFLWALNLAVVNGWLLYHWHAERKNQPKREQLDLVELTTIISDAQSRTCAGK